MPNLFSSQSEIVLYTFCPTPSFYEIHPWLPDVKCPFTLALKDIQLNDKVVYLKYLFYHDEFNVMRTNFE
jgi:hypothetical protein